MKMKVLFQKKKKKEREKRKEEREGEGGRNNLNHYFFFFPQLTVYGMNKGKVSHLPEDAQSLDFPLGLVVDGLQLIEFPLFIDCGICQAIHPAYVIAAFL